MEYYIVQFYTYTWLYYIYIYKCHNIKAPNNFIKNQLVGWRIIFAFSGLWSYQQKWLLVKKPGFAGVGQILLAGSFISYVLLYDFLSKYTNRYTFCCATVYTFQVQSAAQFNIFCIQYLVFPEMS